MQNDTFHFSNFFGGNAARLAAENDRLREQLLQATAENVQLGETLQQIQQIATAETGELRDALKKSASSRFYEKQWPLCAGTEQLLS